MSLKLSKHLLLSSVLTSPWSRNKQFTNWHQFRSHTLKISVPEAPFYNYEWLINFHSYNNSNNNLALPSILREWDTDFNVLLHKSLIKIELTLVTQRDAHLLMRLCGHRMVWLSCPGEDGMRIPPLEISPFLYVSLMTASCLVCCILLHCVLHCVPMGSIPVDRELSIKEGRGSPVSIIWRTGRSF